MGSCEAREEGPWGEDEAAASTIRKERRQGSVTEKEGQGWGLDELWGRGMVKRQ